MDEKDYSHLMTEYLSICNKALEKNSDKFPYKQILQSIQSKDKGETVEVHIIDDYFTPHFRIKIDQDHVKISNCAGKDGCCRACIKRQWHIQSSYLQDVIDHPDTYINNPALMNWDWLQSETGDYLSLHGKPDEQAEQL
jgi:hypothetical protein